MSTSSAQPAVPQAISSLVMAELARLEIQEAVLVDDALQPGLSAGQWLEAVETLQQHDHDSYQRLEEAVSGQVGTLEVLPPAELLPIAIRIMSESGSAEVRAFLSSLPASDVALERLEQGLTALGLTVRKFWRVETHVPRDGKLYFLDYRLRPEQPETRGQDVSILLKDIVDRLREEGQPPGAILMSRSFTESPSADLEVVARDGGGFVRSNFRYLEKTQLDGSEQLLFVLLDLLKSLPLGREYFARVRSLRIATKGVVDRVAAETCGLLPADFNPFLFQLTGGDDRLGARIADHMLDLFAGLLAAELRNDPDVNNSISGLVNLLKESSMTAPPGLESHTLHRIHQRLIYDRSEWAIRSSPSFGDIYRRKGDDTGYYLLVNPECDLELRIGESGALAPKIKKLLFVRGMTRDARPMQKDDRYVITSLAEDSPGSPMKWLYWDLRDIAVVRVRQVGPKGLLHAKWGRLRRQEAEDIQMRVSSDLLAVGKDDVSGRVRQKVGKVVVRAGDGAEVVLGDVAVMEIEPPGKEGESHWALGLGSEFILGTADNSRLTATFVTELRCYMPAKEFIKRLQSHKVVVAHDGDRIDVCFWPKTASLPKKNEWKGPSLSTPVPVAGGATPAEAPDPS